MFRHFFENHDSSSAPDAEHAADAFFRGGPGRRRWQDRGDDFGPPPFGPFGRAARGFGRRAERFLERGELKFVILDLLQEQPRHGYDIIRALEDRFGGFYSPSPGVIYPTLQLLEDQGAVTGTEQDGKKVYTITDAGRLLLSERHDTMSGIHERMRAWGHGRHADGGALMGEVQGLARTLFAPATRGWWADPEKVRRVRAILAGARAEIERALHGGPSGEPPTL